MEILSGFGVVVDGTDNFPTRYLLNDACAFLGIPCVYGSVFRFEGQVSVFHPKAGGPCYRCLFPAPPPPGLVPSCAEGGVLGVLPGVVGTLQALAAIRLIVGLPEPLVGRLLLFDALGMKFQDLALKKNPECPLCGARPSIRTLIDYEDFCGVTTAGTVKAGQDAAISPEELKSRLDAGEKVFLLDVREPGEHAICNLGGVLIPRGELPNRLGELDPAAEIVVYCKTGNRSAQAVDFLRQCGFGKLRNLAGGIDAWAERIDPSMPRY
jgi:adenylyltransferase/sulfurtransferase